MALVKEFIIGDTFQVTWVDSSISALDASSVSIVDGSENLIVSLSLSNSGNGHFYADITLDTSSGFVANKHYVARTNVTVGGVPYQRAKKFKVISYTVD